MPAPFDEFDEFIQLIISAEPPVEDCWYDLVTAVDETGEEGTLGLATATERSNRGCRAGAARGTLRGTLR